MAPNTFRIGIDFDNTLVSYHDVFREAAQARGLVAADFNGDKLELRTHLRGRPEGEIAWQHLQAHAYGPGILRAKASPGALQFIATCRARGARVCIISHKTQFAGMDPTVDLRSAATAWLRENGVLGHDRGIDPNDVHFASTRREKLKLIAQLHCTHFIDDLPEVLDDPDFPPTVRKYLFGTASGGRYRSWVEIADDIFDA